MTPQRSSIPTRRRARRALAASSVAALLLVAVACGDDDDTAATTTTTTTAADEETTTSTTADDETDGDDEPEDDDADDGAVDAELLALLPDVSAIEPRYTEVPDVGDDDEDDAEGGDDIEDALAQACPEAAAMLDEGDDEDDTAEREYDGDLERSVSVGLDPTPRNLDEDTIDDAVAAVASCETMTLSQDGMDVTIDLTAERDDNYGDRGVLLTMNLSMAHPQLPAPITLEMRGRIFQVGSLGAQVNVTSGFDETTFEPVEGDFHLLDTLAAELETAAAAHQG